MLTFLPRERGHVEFPKTARRHGWDLLPGRHLAWQRSARAAKGLVSRIMRELKIVKPQGQLVEFLVCEGRQVPGAPAPWLNETDQFVAEFKK